jgi:hypothetical protein
MYAAMVLFLLSSVVTGCCTRVHRAADMEKGWELVPTATLTASQTPGEVIVKANGEAPTAGYQVKLVQDPKEIFPPQFSLQWKKPDGPAAQVVTPFEVTASFKAGNVVKTVSVTDARGAHTVKVDQARD